MDELELFISKYLSDRYWRLNNLYYIIDKEDNLVLLKMNSAQKQLYWVPHNKTITLKSRQRGISTFKVAEGLDKCIFNENTQAGIQSYGQTEAKKLYKKALVMWNNFDEDIKELLDIKLTSANQEGMTFSNGSNLRIGNFRGDTISNLHVSELAKIAKKFPEKAEELNTGAFEAVSTNSSISIESTAEGKTGLFHDMYRTAERRLKEVGGDYTKLSPLDFAPVFLSWMEDPDCWMDVEYPPSSSDIEYFKKVEEETGIVLKPQQKWWASAKRERLKDKFDREYPYSPDSAFNVKIEGSIYKDEYEALFVEQRIVRDLVVPHLETVVSYDLGVNDSTDLIFTQVHNGRPKVVYHYQNRGKPIKYYVEVMVRLQKELKLGPITVILPHDANVTELQTGRTRIEEFRRLGCKVKLLGRLGLEEGIEATRQFLRVCYIDPEHCDTLLTAIQTYRWKYDSRLQVHLLTPEHDEASNPCDSLRYTSLGIHYNKTLLNKPVKKPTKRPDGFSV